MLASQAPLHVCFYCRIDRFYIGKKKKIGIRFRSFPVRSVSLLIAIIVSKAFMSKACIMSFWVIQWISYFENTAFESTMIITKKQKKSASLPHQIFWKLAWEANNFFCLALTVCFYWRVCTKPGNWPVMYMCVKSLYQARKLTGHVYVC